ncbi:spermidine/putrescine ABC transporter substrate-binding protein, partial [Streptomyces sp. Ru71]
MRFTPAWKAAAAAAVLLAATACGSSDDKAGGGGLNPPDLKAPTKLGAPEGQVNLIAWAGYVEDGSNDPKVNWVSGFEKQTGCQVHSKVA